MTMTPQEILLAAAEDLAKHGHNKQNFYGTPPPGKGPESAPACAMGSIARVMEAPRVWNGYATLDISSHPAVHLLAEQIHREMPGWVPGSDDYVTVATFNYVTVATFNDLPSTTGEDVILAMKKAASL